MELSKKERLFLFNQYKILEKLYPDEPEMWKEQQEITFEGYESEYDMLTECMGDIPSQVGEEVKDILYMFRSLYDSYLSLSDKSGIEERQVIFGGFDGNGEGKHYVFAEYFINEDRYSEFENCVKNSHYPVIDRYRRMLAQRKAYPPYDELSKEAILSILNA